MFACIITGSLCSIAQCCCPVWQLLKIVAVCQLYMENNGIIRCVTKRLQHTSNH